MGHVARVRMNRHAVDTLSAVRRSVFVFLLMLLPFQFVWAAAASACMHESSSTTSHLGHHAHKHVGTPTDNGSSPAAEHADCGVCHLWAAKVCAEESRSPRIDSVAAPRSALALIYASHVPDGPERPDRITAP